MKNTIALGTLIFLALSIWTCDKSDPLDQANPDKTIKGCGDFSVNKLMGEDMIVSIWISHHKIAFSKDFQSFENIAAENFATVEIEQSCEIDKVWYGVCNDVLMPTDCPTIKWKLESGRLSFKVSKVLQEYNCVESYLATVVLEDATFKKEGSSETLSFENITFSNVLVGRCAG